MLARITGDREEERRRKGREETERVLEAVGLTGEEAIQGRMREGHAGREILEEAQDWDSDLIVVGSHGFGFFDRLMLGSTALFVLRHGHRATVVVPSGQPGN